MNKGEKGKRLVRKIDGSKTKGVSSLLKNLVTLNCSVLLLCKSLVGGTR